ncbi:alpha/beta hydrolase [Saccharopolyspora mangrovi]|uniref:Alpha/beta hydrolase n=1 Tax=Saccharopolyspora mangrovi TaxID=3082379 RepID=A0ABU6A890_9PSEU|nr:alpha/beta hydrolase [Saccharopolyspora sp. S2-29]MEB3367714.1 alpha/beta hydrolase [Saccharopolyspora sp. S2-29]
MAKMDLRVRMLGKALSLAPSVTGMTDEQLIARQPKYLPRNRIVDYLLGARPSGVITSDLTAAGSTGRIGIRVYRPMRAAEPLPMIINIHGGGWISGNLDMGDWLCGRVAKEVGAVVVSLDYRLAPAHRFPAAVEDCYAALLDLAGRAADLGAVPGRIAVMGDSAGGNLAAVMCLLARDRSGPEIAFQGLIYPATDLTLGSESLERNANAPVITTREARTMRDAYLGGQDPANPLASPLKASTHEGLPPALIQVAEHDPIRDDGLRYAEALRAAGVPVRTTTYVGMPHGYMSFPNVCRSAPQALGELCSELSAALEPVRVAD